MVPGENVSGGRTLLRGSARRIVNLIGNRRCPGAARKKRDLSRVYLRLQASRIQQMIFFRTA
jgi:hypothetical protein